MSKASGGAAIDSLYASTYSTIETISGPEMPAIPVVSKKLVAYFAYFPCVAPVCKTTGPHISGQRRSVMVSTAGHFNALAHLKVTGMWMSCRVR